MRLVIGIVAICAFGAFGTGAPALAEDSAGAGDTLTDASAPTPAPVAPAAAAPGQMTVIPRARWDHRPDGGDWTAAAWAALDGPGAGVLSIVPRDIDTWCPAYRDAGPAQRKAFWVGFVSALARHESTHRAQAVGGGGRWFGLMQIAPATARGYGCAAGTGEALKDGPANLTCALRIMAVTVPRDGVIADHDGRWRGVAADWGPLTSRQRRDDMAGWLRRQSYCVPIRTIRPKARPF